MFKFIYSIALSFIGEVMSRFELPFNYKKIRKIRIEKLINNINPSDLELVEYYFVRFREYEKEISLEHIKSKSDEEIQEEMEKEISLYQDYVLNNVMFENRDSEILFYHFILNDLESRHIISSYAINIFSITILILSFIAFLKIFIHIALYLIHKFKTWILSLDKTNKLLGTIKNFIGNEIMNNSRPISDEYNIFQKILIGLFSPVAIILAAIYFVGSIFYDFVRIDIVMGLIVNLSILWNLIYTKKREYVNNIDNKKREFINQQLLSLSEKLI